MFRFSSTTAATYTFFSSSNVIVDWKLLNCVNEVQYLIYQKSWRISGWATDPIHLVEVFRATHDDGTIDWNADYIKLFLEGYQPSPPMITFLNQKNRRANEYISLNTYYLPIKEAINIQMM